MKFLMHKLSLRAWLSGFVVLLAAMVTSVAQEKERVSQPGELQTNPKIEKTVVTAKMPAKASTGETPAGGPMQLQLKRPLSPVVGKKQPAVKADQGAQLPPEQGVQRPARAPAKVEGTHLHLVLEVTEGGEAKVLRATEVPGPVATPDATTSDFIYEVASGDKTIQVQSVPDPFEMRSFAPADAPEQGHHFERAKTATMVVRVPNMRLSSPSLNTLAIRVYKLKPGVTIEKMDLPTLKDLKQRNNIDLRYHLVPQQLAPQIHQHAIKPVDQ